MEFRPKWEVGGLKAKEMGEVMPDRFRPGQPVRKVGGDYRFDGVVVAVFRKLSGQVRYVVEDDRGVLFIFNEKNLAERWATALENDNADAPPSSGGTSA